MAQWRANFSCRNLTKSQLGGVVFGCTKNTFKECMSKQLFGLPYNHITYVQKIDIGLPLFLFNYSDRKLHGIFEAAGSGQLNIDPYGWTSDGSERTSYPAQVQISVRLQCEPLSEEKFKPAIADNYYSPHHFWFELDHFQTNKLAESTSPILLHVPQALPRAYHSAAASLPGISENHPDVQNSKQIDKDYVLEKLKDLALSHEHGDASLMKTARQANIPTCKNLEDRDILEEETCAEGKRDGNSLVSSPRLHTISQLMHEVKELRAFELENSTKRCYLEEKLLKETGELMQWPNRTISLVLNSIPFALFLTPVSSKFGGGENGHF